MQDGRGGCGRAEERRATCWMVAEDREEGGGLGGVSLAPALRKKLRV